MYLGKVPPSTNLGGTQQVGPLAVSPLGWLPFFFAFQPLSQATVPLNTLLL
jgi:hypothetical protein